MSTFILYLDPEGEIRLAKVQAPNAQTASDEYHARTGVFPLLVVER